MPDAARTVAIGGAQVNCRCHVCAFFQSSEEEYEAFVPFMAEGFQRGDRLIQIIDEDRRAERMGRLAERGLDVVGAAASGQLEVQTWREAYLSQGRFDQRKMIARVGEMAQAGASRGVVTRVWANMEWALQDVPGAGDLIEYESRVNYTLAHRDMATVCVYDLRKFSTTMIMDVLRAHPQVLTGGVLQDNPFYSPPGELLPELAARAKHWP